MKKWYKNKKIIGPIVALIAIALGAAFNIEIDAETQNTIIDVIVQSATIVENVGGE